MHTGFQSRRPRTFSSSSLDPNEDPVTGLERVASMSNVSELSRRRRQEEEEYLNRRQRRVSQPDDDHSTLSSKFESLNYEICENEIYREEEKNPKHSLSLFTQARNRWFVCFIVGVATALVASSIDILIHYSKEVKFDFILKNLMSKCDQQYEPTGEGCMWMVLAGWISYNCVLVLIAAMLVIYVSPVAAGSGIPQVKCYLNGVTIPDVVKFKTLVAKSVGVACSVAGGLCAGKEGPMIHSGAVVGSTLSEGQFFGISTGFLKEFKSDRIKRDFVAAGAAAGVSAAFGAPIGGVLFALEEGSSFWNQNLTWRLFFTAMVSSFTLNCVLSWFFGKSGWLSWSGLANFGVFENKNYNIWEIPFFLLIGIIGGLTGALFNHLNGKISVFRKKYVANKFQRLLECLLVAAVSAFTGFVTLFLVDDCKAVGVNPNVTSINQMWCKKGEYSAVANLFFANPEDNVKSLFHSPINSYLPSTLIIFSIQYFFLTLWTFGISVPSGVFIPALLTGAAWGRLFGIGVGRMFPSITGIDPGKYALVGAAAQLGGLVRMTISLTTIMMEATKDITFGLPIMLVLMTTKWVGDLFNEGLYDTIINLQEIPLLGWNPPKMSRNILAEKVMRSDVIALEERERVNRVLEILRTTSHHGFPIVDRIDEFTDSDATNLPDYGHLKGIILRSDLISLLKNKVYYDDQTDPDARTVDLTTDNDLNSLEIPASDMGCWMYFKRYMHPHPHRVPLNASLPFIFRLFRGLGLRYIVVVNDENRLRGIITRKDVARFREKRENKSYRVEELFISEDTL
ncbi:unnamed protein product [Auanema sp. JU1783]|nr:unnamed protein product [Auanema sp. JU1783]